MKQFWKSESGQGMVEYGLIIALVAVVVIVASPPSAARQTACSPASATS